MYICRLLNNSWWSIKDGKITLSLEGAEFDVKEIRDLLDEYASCYNQDMNNRQPVPQDGLTFVRGGQELRTVSRDGQSSIDYDQLLEGAQRPDGENVRSFAERHPGRPKVNLLLDFDPHVTADNLAHFPERLAVADICLLEGGGQDALERAEAYQSIADRDADLDPPNLLDDYIHANRYKGTVDETIIRALYGSHKVIGCVDLTQKDLPLGLKIAKASIVKPDYAKGGYTPVRDDVASKWLRNGQLQRQREEINEAQLEPELERLLTKYPQLANKDELNVLWTMGLFHSGSLLASVESEEGLEISRRVPEGVVFGYRNELARLGASGAGEPSEDLKDKAYLETVIRPWIIGTARAGATEGSALISPLDEEIYLRDMVSRFSGGDIRMIFQNDRLGRLNLDRLNRGAYAKGAGASAKNP